MPVVKQYEYKQACLRRQLTLLVHSGNVAIWLCTESKGQPSLRKISLHRPVRVALRNNNSSNSYAQRCQQRTTCYIVCSKEHSQCSLLIHISYYWPASQLPCCRASKLQYTGPLLTNGTGDNILRCSEAMPGRERPKTPRFRHSWGAARTAHRCSRWPDSSASCAESTGTAEATLPPSAHIVRDRASRERSPPCCGLARCTRSNVPLRTTNDPSEQSQDRAVLRSATHVQRCVINST
jgi:hypothetical protein